MASKYNDGDSAFTKRPSASHDDAYPRDCLHSKSNANRFPATPLGLRWLRSWPIVVLILFGILGTVGTTAIVSLFRIPTLPNCRAVFWPTASAALRLQCADSYAAEGSVKNLLAAIKLVDQLPADHPLRTDINQRIEGWASQVLDLAERSFEAGDLEGAIASARKIPAKTAAARLVEERIARWQKIWKEGEDTFNTAVAQLKKKDFQKAFSLSVKLLDVDNKYWATEKYNELTKLIGVARTDLKALSEALGFAKEGTVKGFTEALKRLKNINKESIFYAEAQSERKNIAKRMLQISEELLANRQLSSAQVLLSAIPRDTGINREIADFQIFVTAYQQAWIGSVDGLESAISRMKTLGKDRPRYAQGQRLIAQWEGELRNLTLLSQAQEQAGRGSTADLGSAISTARQISRDSPQWEEAAKQINKWQTRIETVEDRPILERGDRLAAVGTPDNLRAAIQEVRKISSGRTLRNEAENRIADWTGRIQRLEDQPLLDQARQRANTGDLAGAIAIASRIGQGRVLYNAAQDDIDGWQVQENGRLRLDEALTVAARGDVESLTRAIDLAQQVPSQSSNRDRADSQIDQWSWELLDQAESAAERSLDQAISIAGRIPSQAEAYETAQSQISAWQAARRRSVEDSQRPLPSAPGSDPNTGALPNTLQLAPPP
ncbi:MAG: chromosome segregation ATPase [Phormidesmis priestleyi]|uniref:Chromosome segregation ATPase n=1 Tax=Phormidesmis priestleyi TaxID=268141 RepID=A0A2W4WWF5_9CYAN|nr:MAG: chromosome segregation ATPase [Phormidesmis priestleyi]